MHTVLSCDYLSMAYAQNSLRDIRFFNYTPAPTLAQKGLTGEALTAFADFPHNFSAQMQLAEHKVVAPFVYCGNGSSRIAYSATMKSQRFVIKFAHQKYNDDDNEKEYEVLLDESIVPRVYGFLVMPVFGQDVSLLVMEREDITLRNKFHNMTKRQATSGEVRDFVQTCEMVWNLFLDAIHHPHYYTLHDCHVNLASLNKHTKASLCYNSNDHMTHSFQLYLIFSNTSMHVRVYIHVHSNVLESGN